MTTVSAYVGFLAAWIVAFFALVAVRFLAREIEAVDDRSLTGCAIRGLARALRESYRVVRRFANELQKAREHAHSFVSVYTKNRLEELKETEG